MATDDFVDSTHYHIGVYTSLLNASHFADHLEARLWTDVTNDVLRRETVSVERGIRDDSPISLVASTGIGQLYLNNAQNNSGGKLGYYSPGHPDCRPGFRKGVAARIQIVED